MSATRTCLFLAAVSMLCSSPTVAEEAAASTAATSVGSLFSSVARSLERNGGGVIFVSPGGSVLDGGGLGYNGSCVKECMNDCPANTDVEKHDCFKICVPSCP